MANETELEKIDRAAEYFERYFEFEDAVTVSKENKEYLKTYIHDNDYVVKNFNIKNKIIKSLGISIGIGLVAFLLLWLLLGTKLIIVGIIAGALIFIGAGVFGIALNKYRLTAAEQKQVEVNEGINEQIIMLDCCALSRMSGKTRPVGINQRSSPKPPSVLSVRSTMQTPPRTPFKSA